jgi:hypothetical protein
MPVWYGSSICHKKGPDPMTSLSIWLGLTFQMPYGVMETESAFISIVVFLTFVPHQTKTPNYGYYAGLVP